MKFVTTDKWVLITGANSGIGKATTELLRSKGFKIYACARKDTDLEDLSKIEGVVPIKLDVRNEKNIADVVEFVDNKGTGLYGLINNAGIGVLGPLIDISPIEFEKQLDVNLTGIHRITRAFFPFLLKSGGRIVMISSGLGRTGIPFSGAYCASKFGLEGYSDTLRREIMLIDDRMKLIVLEPGIVKTPIWKKNYEYSFDVNKSLFKDALLQWRKIDKSPYDEGKKSLNPIDIARVIFKALTAKNPKIRYFITEKNVFYRILQGIPEHWKDIVFKIIIKK